jgi:hypothetical protein
MVFVISNQDGDLKEGFENIPNFIRSKSDIIFFPFPYNLVQANRIIIRVNLNLGIFATHVEL